MRTTLIVAILFVAMAAQGQMLGFVCSGKSTDGDSHVWTYKFEVNRQTNKGIIRGKTYGGDDWVDDIAVVFTPERMRIKVLGMKGEGYIDRTNLTFYFEEAVGTCKMVTVAKPKTKF